MQIQAPVITIGWIVAIFCLLVALLGMLGVVPFTPVIVFGLIGGVAIARLL
jgi:hypothetical protein